MARELGARIEQSSGYELLAPVRLNIVCFSPAGGSAGGAANGGASVAEVAAIVNAIGDDGRTFVTPTALFGRPAIRAAFSNWRTTEADLDLVWSALSAAAG